jgi:hypothetical protein
VSDRFRYAFISLPTPLRSAWWRQSRLMRGAPGIVAIAFALPHERVAHGYD